MGMAHYDYSTALLYNGNMTKHTALHDTKDAALVYIHNVHDRSRDYSTGLITNNRAKCELYIHHSIDDTRRTIITWSWKIDFSATLNGSVVVLTLSLSSQVVCDKV